MEKKGMKNEDDIEIATRHTHRIKFTCLRTKIYEHSKGSLLEGNIARNKKS